MMKAKCSSKHCGQVVAMVTTLPQIYFSGAILYWGSARALQNMINICLMSSFFASVAARSPDSSAQKSPSHLHNLVAHPVKPANTHLGHHKFEPCSGNWLYPVSAVKTRAIWEGVFNLPGHHMQNG